MDRETELSLIDEILALEEEGSAYLDESVTRSDVQIYLDPERFAREQAAIFRGLPAISVHSSELAGPGAFLRKEIAGLPVLLTRDREGRAHAFLNVCRHRGARLVEEERGCKTSFTCPYHAWTFGNDGALRGVPHEAQGFPGLDKAQMGLVALPCAERYGWVWVTADRDATPDLNAHLAEIGPDLDWLGMERLRVAHSDEILCRANWKLLIEGGIEAYHFRVAHAATIAPYFHDNLSSYRMFGAHMRSIIPRRSMTELKGQPREAWHIREHSNVLYSLFPTNQLLVQADHIAWIQMQPKSAEETLIRLSTVVPADTGAEMDGYWAKNHAITSRTLIEDFKIGEAIQAGLASGANDMLTFGRYEGALDRFNTLVREMLAAA